MILYISAGEKYLISVFDVGLHANVNVIKCDKTAAKKTYKL